MKAALLVNRRSGAGQRTHKPCTVFYTSHMRINHSTSTYNVIMYEKTCSYCTSASAPSIKSKVILLKLIFAFLNYKYILRND
jgi:hypothetical protein